MEEGYEKKEKRRIRRSSNTRGWSEDKAKLNGERTWRI